MARPGRLSVTHQPPYNQPLNSSMTLLIVTLSPALPTAATLCAGVLSNDGRTALQSVEAPTVRLFGI